MREATLDDAASLATLFQKEAEWAQQLAGYFELERGFDWDASVRTKIKNPQHAIFVAVADSAFAGFIHVRLVRIGGTARRRPSNWIERLRRRPPPQPRHPIKALLLAVIEGCYVEAASRRRGVGGKLVEKACEWCHLKEVERIELGVLLNNEAAFSFWKDQGFETFRVGMHKRNG